MVRAMQELRGALATLERVMSALDASRFDGERAAEMVEAFARGERLCAAGKSLCARRVDDARVWKRDGHRTAAHWLAHTTGSTLGDATEALRTARALEQLPDTSDAFRAGALSSVQAAEITAAAGADADAETALLRAAASESLQALRARCREVRDAASDDASRARRLHETRSVRRWYDVDGAYRADVRLAPEAGAIFDAALEQHIDRIHDAGRRAQRRETRAAYAADALIALVREGARKPVDLRLTVDHAAVVRGHVERGERCELNGAAIPVTVARSLLDDARVSVIARDGTDIRTVSRPTRTIPAALRRALEARYPTCGVIGCDGSFFLQIDHVVPIAAGGPTTLENTWRICWHHHNLKTYSGWVVVGDGIARTLEPPDPGRGPPSNSASPP